MEKKGKVLIVAAVVAVLALGIGSGAAFAQRQTPAAGPAPQTDYGPGWCHGSGYRFDQVTLTRIADLLGLTTDELQAQLDEGKTLAEIAQSQGVSEDTLIDTILALMQEHLAVAVKYGYLTQEQADETLAQAQDRLSTVITRQATPSTTGTAQRGTRSMPWSNGRGGYGGMMGGGMMGDGYGSMMGGGGMMGGGMMSGYGRGGYGGMMGR